MMSRILCILFGHIPQTMYHPTQLTRAAVFSMKYRETNDDGILVDRSSSISVCSRCGCLYITDISTHKTLRPS